MEKVIFCVPVEHGPTAADTTWYDIAGYTIPDAIAEAKAKHHALFPRHVVMVAMGSVRTKGV